MTHPLGNELRNTLNKLNGITSKEQFAERGLKVKSTNPSVIPQKDVADVALILKSLLNQSRGMTAKELAEQVMEQKSRHPLWKYYEHDNNKILKNYYIQRSGFILSAIEIREVILEPDNQQVEVITTKMFVSGSKRNGQVAVSTGNTKWKTKTPEIVTSLSEIKIRNMIQEFRSIDLRYRNDYGHEVGLYLDRIKEIVNEIESEVVPTLVSTSTRTRRQRRTSY